MVSGHWRLALQSWPVKLFTEPYFIYISEVHMSLNSSLSPCRHESVEFFIKLERTNIKFKMPFIISRK